MLARLGRVREALYECGDPCGESFCEFYPTTDLPTLAARLRPLEQGGENVVYELPSKNVVYVDKPQSAGLTEKKNALEKVREAGFVAGMFVLAPVGRCAFATRYRANTKTRMNLFAPNPNFDGYREGEARRRACAALRHNERLATKLVVEDFQLGLWPRGLRVTDPKRLLPRQASAPADRRPEDDFAYRLYEGLMDDTIRLAAVQIGCPPAEPAGPP